MDISKEALESNKRAIVNSFGLLLQGSSSLSLLEILLQDGYSPIDAMKLDASLIKINRNFAESLPNLLKVEDPSTREKLLEIIKVSTDLHKKIVELTGVG